jgi:hypothetical protein
MALVGGSLGALCGSRHLPVPAILKAMSCMLVMAGGKMFLLSKKDTPFLKWEMSFLFTCSTLCRTLQYSG